MADPPPTERDQLEHQLSEIRKQHELQHEILLRHFEIQREHLAQQHADEVRKHMEMWNRQLYLKELRERDQRIDAIRRKDKHEQSAIASTEVKHKLQAFLRQRASGASTLLARAQASAAAKTSTNTCWTKSVSMDSESQDNGDFPLGKTASEPNLLKVRLKQRVMERRCSPMTKRHLPPTMRKKLLINSCMSASNESSQSSSGTTLGSSLGGTIASATTMPSAATATPTSPTIVTGATPPTITCNPMVELMSAKDLSPPASSMDMTNPANPLHHHALFSSPSMPNISLATVHHLQAQHTTGTPTSMIPPTSAHVHPAAQHLHVPISSATAADLSGATVRAACRARLGLPLTGQLLTGTLPYYPSLPAIDSELEDPHLSGASMSTSIHLDTISEMQEPQSGSVIRPLGRTQSSPLPLGHPLLLSKCSSTDSEPIPQTTLHHLPPPLSLVQPRTAQPSHSFPIHTQMIATAEPLSSDTPTTNHCSGFVMPTYYSTTHNRSDKLHESTPYSRSIRPLSRTFSSPVVHLDDASGHGVPSRVPYNGATAVRMARRRSSSGPTTGLAYDNQMLKHGCVCGSGGGLHPEHAGRLQSIWSRLLETGLVARCDRLRPRKASTQELQLCHSETYVILYGSNSQNRQMVDVSKLDIDAPFVRLPCGGIGVDDDTTWNEAYTAMAARMAVGCTVDLAVRTWTGDIRNGFAVVRPPGHHAEHQQAMGFCFFNSIAIAARILQQEHHVQKIMIVDWGFHHGNGTQQAFYEDGNVLVVSLHRHDDGNFFPGTGDSNEIGCGAGHGFNINVAWCGGLNPPLGDAEYLAAFRSIVTPIGREFAPDMVLVSAGFDASRGHHAPLGGYRLSPACFGYMAHELMKLCNGRVVMALEGGYNLPSICDAAEECVHVLLGDAATPIETEELNRPPCSNAALALLKLGTTLRDRTHWKCVKDDNVFRQVVICSHADIIRAEREDRETVSAMASLSMQQRHQHHLTQHPLSMVVQHRSSQGSGGGGGGNIDAHMADVDSGEMAAAPLNLAQSSHHRKYDGHHVMTGDGVDRTTT